MAKELEIKIQNLKNIKNLCFKFPIEKGLYVITGENGAGKSTVMTVLSKVIRPSALEVFQRQDYSDETSIEISFDGKVNCWVKPKGYRKWQLRDANVEEIKRKGFSEGSLIHGSRFADSQYQSILKAEKIRSALLIDADPFIKDNLSRILHGKDGYYSDLKRIRSKPLAEFKTFKGLPFFIQGTNGLSNQFCMSTGEYMLISLLNIVWEVVVRPKDDVSQTKLILIDEVELSLHPAAIIRLVDFLSALSDKYNLAIYFSSHSVELIHRIEQRNIFYLQNDSGNISVINPCYPAYATRNIYQHDGYDFLFLVEDELSKYIVGNIIDEERLYNNKLYVILPVGGWQNVLKMQDEICKSHLARTGIKVISLLDGDIEEDYNKCYKAKGIYTQYPVNFLAIPSLEKYLLDKLITSKDADFFKELGDRFFHIQSLQAVIDGLQKKDDGKALYKYLINCLREQNVDEKIFVTKVCDMIYKRENMSKNVKFIRGIFSK